MPAMYTTRFIPNTPEARGELVNLFHLARVALAGSDQSVGTNARATWASKRFHEAHPEVTSLGAYKDLLGLLAWN